MANGCAACAELPVGNRVGEGRARIACAGLHAALEHARHALPRRTIHTVPSLSALTHEFVLMSTRRRTWQVMLQLVPCGMLEPHVPNEPDGTAAVSAGHGSPWQVCSAPCHAPVRHCIGASCSAKPCDREHTCQISQARDRSAHLVACECAGTAAGDRLRAGTEAAAARSRADRRTRVGRTRLRDAEQVRRLALPRRAG